jgi:hypothetical protein
MTTRLKIIGGGALVIGAAAILYALDPARAGMLPGCPFHALTGLWCPGCGSTRALHQLLHGHLSAAFGFNPLAISLLPLVGYLAVRGEKATLKPAMIWILLGMIVMFGVLRNVPVYPLTLLAP